MPDTSGSSLRVVLFSPSLVSDRGQESVHFLRGVVGELIARGHDVHVHQPVDEWVLQEHVARKGDPTHLPPSCAGASIHDDTRENLDLEQALDGANLVLVHDRTEPWLIASLGAHRARHRGYRLLFHDTSHRSASDPESLARLDLSAYDGVLVLGSSVRDRY